jgi:predicted AAA+ superfamily ATPase
MPDASMLPRLAEPALREALSDTPVVLVHGPRQCGKTTLAMRVGERLGFGYFNLDEEPLRQAARADPAGFVAGLPERAVIDEAQRAPDLFLAIKLAVDRRRAAGRFLLTGSTNILLLPDLADSLAGRIGTIRLHPFAQCEFARRPAALLGKLLSGKFVMARGRRAGEDLAARIATGGFPAAAARRTPGRRAQWYADYVESLVQRDVRDLARIASPHVLPRLLKLAASQTARLLNITDLAGPFQLSRLTIRDYVTLLERLFVIEELQPWHGNRLSRLIKMPKLHVADTGLACALLGLGPRDLRSDRETFGQLLETFVYGELRRQASALHEPIEFAHFRDKDGLEVDIVLEHSGAKVSGVQVKSASSVNAADLRGLRRLKDVVGKRFACGIILCDGDVTVAFADDLFAVPITELWA